MHQLCDRTKFISTFISTTSSADDDDDDNVVQLGFRRIDHHDDGQDDVAVVNDESNLEAPHVKQRPADDDSHS